jgi:hypothetical protein
MKKLIIVLLLLPTLLSAQQYSNKATAFVNTLDSTRKAKAVSPFEAVTRYHWHYLPAYMVARSGLAVKDLDENQKVKFYEMLKEFLSDRGYNRTKDIMSYEVLLKEMEPKNPSRIPENYYINVFGNPANDKTWAWKFSGHHVALNFTIVDDKLAFTPFFFGVYPAVVKEGPKKGNELLREEEQAGLSLINSLSADQKTKAMIQPMTFNDIVTTNAVETAPLAEKGIAAKELTQEQKLMLNKLIVTYLSSMPEKIGKYRMDKVSKEDMDQVHFAWAGGYDQTTAHYYRVQGKTFLIEFDNSQSNANHIHTVWRDFNGDFGADLLQEHYRAHHKQ